MLKLTSVENLPIRIQPDGIVSMVENKAIPAGAVFKDGFPANTSVNRGQFQVLETVEEIEQQMKEKYNSLQAANLVGLLQSCRKINSLEWLEKAALKLTEITGEKHWVEGASDFNGVYNHFIRRESIDTPTESC